MNIKKIKFESGLGLPILFRESPEQPAFVSFIYSVLYLKNKAYSTSFNSLHLIKSLYRKAHEYGQDLDELIIGKKLDKVIHYTDEIVFNLDADRNISPGTRNAYLNDLLNFLRWCSNRYCGGKYTQVLEDRLDTFKIKASTAPNNFKSLTQDDEDRLRKLCFPSSELNPFRKNNRFRNWLIIETFLQTGLRLGELLKIRSDDVRQLGVNYYIAIVSRKNDNNDSRANEPSHKNAFSERTVSISEELFFSIEHYIKNLRRPIREGRPMKLSHGYLFVSERGSPITNTAVFELLQVVNAAMKSISKDFHGISAHTFRHTFAERFLQSLIEFQGYDMERAKDILRSYCGWSMNSPMPAFYAKRYISMKANLENIKRIEQSILRTKER